VNKLNKYHCHAKIIFLKVKTKFRGKAFFQFIYIFCILNIHFKIYSIVNKSINKINKLKTKGFLTLHV